MKRAVTLLALSLVAWSTGYAQPSSNQNLSDGEQLFNLKSLNKSMNPYAQEIVLQALSMLETQYRYGGISPQTGFDCSGLVYHIYREAAGLVLPRSAKEMSERGEKITLAELEPGDLVFYNTRQSAFSHVGIYLGNNRFIHAPRRGKDVRIEDMKTIYWKKRFNGARRFLTTLTKNLSEKKSPTIESIIDEWENR